MNRLMLMWKMFFDPSESGMLNQVLGVLGIGAQKWLQDNPEHDRIKPFEKNVG